MPILELFPKPARDSDPPPSRPISGAAPPPPTGGVARAVDLLEATAPTERQIHPAPQRGILLHGRTSPRLAVGSARYEGLEQHELIHLLDALDDERSRARFRESIYLSIIIWAAIAWFLFYGPRVLFHMPTYRDPIALMKEHDKEQLTYVPTHPPALRAAPKLDRKTLEALRQMAKKAPPTPEPPAPQPAPAPPPEVAHNVAPQVPIAPLPLPAAPKPTPSVEAPLPAAPKPNFAQNSQSARNAIEDAMRGGSGRFGAQANAPGSSAPLQAGAEILSDTQGVDFSAYMRRLHDDIQRNWDPLIPEEVQPPLRKKGIVGIRFTILPGGQIGDMKLETTSGDVALDKAAWWAITSEGQFPPLPKAFHGPDLELRCGFFYNIPLQQ